MPADFEKIVLIKKKTGLEELIERFNTRDQARFYLEHMGASFQEYQASHDTYLSALDNLQQALPKGVPYQSIERSFLPTFQFGDRDLVLTLGPDGLVANTAKYLKEQFLLAFNPDPKRVDGILTPFLADQANSIFERVFKGGYSASLLSMAKAELNNGQVLYAVNDLFIGQKTHVSARYRIQYRNKSEDHSSSGIIVSTGVGSTGWFRSVITGANEIMRGFSGGKIHEEVNGEKIRFDWQSNYLYFTVREPFLSKMTSAKIVFGTVNAKESLTLMSYMPQNGVIFSDGIESDYLEFNSSSIVKIRLAEKKLHLITHLYDLPKSTKTSRSKVLKFR